MSYNDLSEDRKLDIVSFGEPTLMFFLAPMRENGALNEKGVSETVEHFRKKDRYAAELASFLCKPYEKGNKFQCGIMNMVTADKVYFVLPNEWNAPAVTLQNDASLSELPDRLDYFLERTFDGFLPLGNRQGSPLKGQSIYVISLGVKLDDVDENLQNLISLSEIV